MTGQPTTTARRTRRPGVAVLLVLLPLAVALGLLSVAESPARAANGADFRAGNIIADSVFFDPNTMGPADIQSFLEAKVPRCAAGVCLRDIYQDTWTRPADAQCGTYEGRAGERASTIIHKVAQACGVNPRVLLVLLQKEQGLVTDDSPSSTQYDKATGYGCPDTAPCDAQFYGVYNQVYKAAWAFKRYTLFPEKYPSKKLYADNQILWSPNAGCGSSNVYIANKATFALYLYTPYQPNAAALNNMYGTGDGCSAYGNRNFWRYFTDWFGSTHFGVVGPISGAYDREGGSRGPLGDAVGAQYATVGGGLSQAFENGRIHWSPATGAHAVLTPLAAAYDAWGGEGGPLGYPVAARYGTANGGWTQAFERGRIHWTAATGAHPVLAEISQAYDSVGGEGGVLGYPVGGRYATANGGFSQIFQNGRIHWSPASEAYAVRGVVAPVYNALGGEGGVLGYPVGGQYATTGGGTTQSFQNGRIHSSPATGTHAVIGPISQAYDGVGGEAGALGYPTSGRYGTVDGGFSQTFENGRIHWSPASGAHVVRGVIAPVYNALKGESGVLGYPVGGQYATTGGGTTQSFQNGRIHSSPTTGTHAVIGPISKAYDTVRGEAGALGYPIGGQYASTEGGLVQAFQRGRIHWSPGTGAYPVIGALSTAYDALQGETGPLGYPTGAGYASTAGGQAQQFDNGTLVVRADGTARTVQGAMGAAYAALGGAAGVLGEPTSTPTAASGGGTTQDFQNGRIFAGPDTPVRAVTGALLAAYDATGAQGGPLGWPIATQTGTTATPAQEFEDGWLVVTPQGPRQVLGDIGATWEALGGVGGTLGVPTADRTTTTSAAVQTFTGGLVVSAPSGTRAVLGDMAAAYAAAGRETGVLGLPTGDRYATTGGGYTQGFQRGRIHFLPATGAFPVTGALSAAYDQLGGESGVLGYPTGTGTSAGGVLRQSFQHGSLVHSAARGAQTVLGPLDTAYSAAGGPAGALGLPVGSRYATPGNGWVQPFENGRIHWSPGTGAHPVLAPIAPAYDAQRGESGALGYPLGGRYATAGGGWTQAFQNGRIHWSSATGAHAVLAPISAAYDALRGESGALGYPLGGRYATAGNGWTQAFQNGRVHWSPTFGAHAVLAPLSATYDGLRGESGVLGYPVGGRYPTVDGGWGQAFRFGRIHWSPATGGFAVYGAMSTAYDGQRGESGSLGYPIAAQRTSSSGVVTQEFQRGTITLTPGAPAKVTLR